MESLRRSNAWIIALTAGRGREGVALLTATAAFMWLRRERDDLEEPMHHGQGQGTDKARRGGRIMLFLIVAALILLVAVSTYTCGYRSYDVIQRPVQPPPAAQPCPDQ
jgi:hypothetical protein